MKISSLIISFVIAAFMLTGMINLYSDLFRQYDTPDTFNISLQNNASDISGGISNIAERFREPKGFLENVGMIIEGGWTAIVTVLTFPNILINAFGTIEKGSQYTIPSWIGLLVNVLVWGVFVFAIFKVIFKVDV